VDKKVVFYLSDFQSGGTEWFAIRLARKLKEKGYQPLFLVTQKKGELIDLIRGEFDTTVLDGKGYCLCAMIRTLPAVRRFLNDKKPDVLISGLPLLNLNAALALLFNKQPCTHIAVEHMRQNERGNLFFMIKKKIKLMISRWVHTKATHVVCVSKTVFGDVVRFIGTPPDHLKIIGNPIIPSSFELLKNEDVPHSWIKKKEGPLLLSIGRLLPVKDFETLLRAFKQVLEKRPARLLLLGEGVELHRLESLIKKLGIESSVSMPGTVRNVFPYLVKADLFVLSSRQEAFGNVIVESLACGTPVVSTACGGPEELIDNGKNGFLVPVGNPSALSAAIVKALDTKFDNAAIKETAKPYSSEIAAKAYIDLIEN